MAALSLLHLMLLNSVTSVPLNSRSATIGGVGFPAVAFCAKERAGLLNIRGGGIQEIVTSEDIQTIIDDHTDTPEGGKGKLVVVEFTSKDCVPCQSVAPLYMELSESDEFEESVLFLKVDVDANPEIAMEYQVTGWPAFLFIKNGDVQTEIVGGKLAHATLYDWIRLLMPK